MSIQHIKPSQLKSITFPHQHEKANEFRSSAELTVLSGLARGIAEVNAKPVDQQQDSMAQLRGEI